MKNTQLLALGLVALGAITLASRPAHALPSSLGFYPSTDIYTKGNIHLDVYSYNSTKFDQNFPAQGITYGVGPDKTGVIGRTEVGYDYAFGNGSLSFGKRISFNAKTQLFNDDKQQIRVVAGGWILGDSATNPNYGYLLASKNVNKIGRFHVGYAHGFSKGVFVAASGNGRASGRDSLQLSYDRLITPKLQFVTDFYSGKGPYAGVQPTVYYSVNDKASFGLGYFRTNNRSFASASRDQIYVSFAYNFDFNKPAPVPANSNPGPATGGEAQTPASNGAPAPAPAAPATP